jgi:hypothetical protein
LLAKLQILCWIATVSGSVLAATYALRARLLQVAGAGARDMPYCYIMALASFTATVGFAVIALGLVPHNPHVVGVGVVLIGLGGLIMATAYIYQAFPAPVPANAPKRAYDVGVALATIIISGGVIWFGYVLPR